MKNLGEKGAWDCPNFGDTPIISRMGKGTDFKFGQHIHRVHPNKSPLKLLEKRERRRIQGLPIFFGYPLLSREKVKLRTSNYACIFISSIETKARYSFGKSSRGRSRGPPKISRAPIHRAHRAVILAIAQLSCSVLNVVILLPYIPNSVFRKALIFWSSAFNHV